jgi:hypothetical protein
VSSPGDVPFVRSKATRRDANFTCGLLGRLSFTDKEKDPQLIISSMPPVTKVSASLSIVYQNVRGLKTKLHMFRTNMLLLDHDIVAISESFLDQSVCDAEVVSNGWSVIRRDRGSWGGGVMLAARPGLSVRRLVDLETASGEDLWATITIQSLTVFVCVVYIPPSSSDSVYMDWFTKVENCIESIKGHVIILGDINLNSATLNVNNYYCYFLSFCNFVDKNEILNSHGSKLDIVLIQECVGVVSVSNSECGGLVRPDLYHPPLDVAIAFENIIRRGSMQPSNISRGRDWNFKRAEEAVLRFSINKLDWSRVLQSQNVDLALELFYESLYGLFDELVPKKQRTKSLARRYPTWFSANIIKDVQKKVKLHRAWKESKCPLSYDLFSNLRASLKLRISLAYQFHIKDLESDLYSNPRNFYRHVNGLRSAGGFEPSVMYQGVQHAGPDAANAFANHFSSVYVRDDTNSEPLALTQTATHIDVGEFSTIDVERAISFLKSGSSPGPDGVPADILKMCKKTIALPLCHLVNLILRLGVFPSAWKLTRVTPIPKSCNKSIVEEHRPIAILSTPAKVFETLICGVIRKQVLPYLCDQQHGFRPGRSVNSNLLTLVEFISDSMDKGLQVDVLYFDFRKAFDRVNCKILLTKLDAMGFSNRLINLFSDYFKGRQQFVRHGCYVSEPYSTPSGVTQGSVLGPLLFLLLINDLVDVLRYTKCLLYADDLKLYARVCNETDCELIQKDIDALLIWSNQNRLEFNCSKCSVMSYGRRQNLIRYSYRLGCDVIDRVDSVRDLGVTFDPSLTFNRHISVLTRNCFSRLGFVLRNSRDFENPVVLKHLYIILIRSSLESSSCVWNPHESKYILMLEKVQKAFLRCYYKRNYSYYPFMYPTKFLLGMLGMNSLEVRRDRIELSTAVAILRGVVESPEYLEQLSRLYVPDNYLRIRSNRRHKLFATPPCRTVARAQAPLCRMHQALNALLTTYPDFDVFVDSPNSLLHKIDMLKL